MKKSKSDSEAVKNAKSYYNLMVDRHGEKHRRTLDAAKYVEMLEEGESKHDN